VIGVGVLAPVDECFPVVGMKFVLCDACRHFKPRNEVLLEDPITDAFRLRSSEGSADPLKGCPILSGKALHAFGTVEHLARPHEISPEPSP
jgi:hypothetical protein